MSLLYKTPDRWADEALKDPLALLSDHAYLERKAASNALDLLNRWPEPKCPKTWVTTLSAIARDEAMHLNQVAQLLLKRGGKLERLHRSTYAADLRTLVRTGQGPHEIADRLLVSGLIEARSAERFEILSRRCPDEALARFYKGLLVSERGHHRTFIQLAGHVIGRDETKRRWEQMRRVEAEIIVRQPPGACLHSGLTTVS